MDRPLRVLLVEDDEDDYVIVTELLQQADPDGYALDWVRHYEAGLEAIRERDYDVCLLDYRLGERTGIELLEDASLHARRIPTILLTGQGDREVDLRGMQAGAMDFLVKGKIDAPMLERSIRYAVERRRAEQALRKERDFIAALFDNASALVVVLDRQGRITRFNWACELATGYSFEEVRGRWLWELFLSPEDAEPIRSVFVRPLPGHFPSQFENFWITRGGRRRRIAWSNAALLDEEGQVEHVVCIGVDITAHRQVEEALGYISKAVESTSEAIRISDAAGRSVYHNRAFQELFGFSVDELNAAGGLPALYADPSISGQILSSIRAHSSWSGEVRMRTRGGAEPIFLHEDAIRDERGQVIGLIGVHTRPPEYPGHHGRQAARS